jgi:hypothetical protein
MFNPLIVLRNPEANEYPYDDEYEDFKENPRWLVCSFDEFWYNGIVVTFLKYYAFISDDMKSYDTINKKNILGSPDYYVSSHLKIIPNEITEKKARVE